MPANRVIETIGIGPHSSVWDLNDATLQHPGELGARFDTYSGKEGQIVILDSGATSSTTVGAVAAGQVAYWRDKAAYKVTNRIEDAVGYTSAAATSGHRNEVAGVFQASVTPGYYCAVQQKGRSVNAMQITTGSPVIGDHIVAGYTTAEAKGLLSTVNTAPPTQVIGRAAAAGSSVSTIAVDLFVEGIV